MSFTLPNCLKWSASRCSSGDTPDEARVHSCLGTELCCASPINRHERLRSDKTKQDTPLRDQPYLDSQLSEHKSEEFPIKSWLLTARCDGQDVFTLLWLLANCLVPIHWTCCPRHVYATQTHWWLHFSLCQICVSILSANLSRVAWRKHRRSRCVVTQRIMR